MMSQGEQDRWLRSAHSLFSAQAPFCSTQSFNYIYMYLCTYTPGPVLPYPVIWDREWLLPLMDHRHQISRIFDPGAPRVMEIVRSLASHIPAADMNES